MSHTEDALILYSKLLSCLSQLSKLGVSRFLEGFPSCKISEHKQLVFRSASDELKDLLPDSACGSRAFLLLSF